MSRILLTGAAGGVGVHVLAHIMHNTDLDVVCLDSFHHKGYRDRLVRVQQNHPDWASRIRILQHDLTCPISPELAKRIGIVNYIIHLAALSDVSFSISNPGYVIKNNVDSTVVMLEYARTLKLSGFVYFSTDEVYGPVQNDGAHDEWDTHRPSNAYAASKAASEDICYAYWRSYGVPVIITNTMNNFGEMQSGSKFPVMVQKWIQNNEEVIIHGNGKEIGTRYYIHSRNVADALLHILKKHVTRHKQGELDEPDRYHIVGDLQLSNLQLAQMISELMGKKFKYKLVDFHKDNPAHDIHYGLVDNKLYADWEAPLSLEDSLKNTIEWQQRNPEWM